MYNNIYKITIIATCCFRKTEQVFKNANNIFLGLQLIPI